MASSSAAGGAGKKRKFTIIATTYQKVRCFDGFQADTGHIMPLVDRNFPLIQAGAAPLTQNVSVDGSSDIGEDPSNMAVTQALGEPVILRRSAEIFGYTFFTF